MHKYGKYACYIYTNNLSMFCEIQAMLITLCIWDLADFTLMSSAFIVWCDAP